MGENIKSNLYLNEYLKNIHDNFQNKNSKSLDSITLDIPGGNYTDTKTKSNNQYNYVTKHKIKCKSCDAGLKKFMKRKTGKKKRQKKGSKSNFLRSKKCLCKNYEPVENDSTEVCENDYKNKNLIAEKYNKIFDEEGIYYLCKEGNIYDPFDERENFDNKSDSDEYKISTSKSRKYINCSNPQNVNENYPSDSKLDRLSKIIIGNKENLRKLHSSIQRCDDYLNGYNFDTAAENSGTNHRTVEDFVMDRCFYNKKLGNCRISVRINPAGENQNRGDSKYLNSTKEILHKYPCDRFKEQLPAKEICSDNRCNLKSCCDYCCKQKQNNCSCSRYSAKNVICSNNFRHLSRRKNVFEADDKSYRPVSLGDISSITLTCKTIKSPSKTNSTISDLHCYCRDNTGADTTMCKDCKKLKKHFKSQPEISNVKSKKGCKKPKENEFCNEPYNLNYTVLKPVESFGLRNQKMGTKKFVKISEDR